MFQSLRIHTPEPHPKNVLPARPPEWEKEKEQAVQTKYIATTFDQEATSDLTVVSGHVRRHVHKLVMCGQSKWFEKACTGAFSERNAKVIELKEDDPAAVDALLRYCYTYDYKLPEGKPFAPAFHIRVFATAEKYEVEGLQRLSAVRAHATLVPVWDKLDTFEALHAAYTICRDPKKVLRRAVIAGILPHIENLLADPEGYSEFHKVMEKTSGLAADCAIEVLRDRKPMEKHIHVWCKHGYPLDMWHMPGAIPRWSIEWKSKPCEECDGIVADSDSF